MREDDGTAVLRVDKLGEEDVEGRAEWVEGEEAGVFGESEEGEGEGEAEGGKGGLRRGEGGGITLVEGGGASRERKETHINGNAGDEHEHGQSMEELPSHVQARMNSLLRPRSFRSEAVLWSSGSSDLTNPAGRRHPACGRAAPPARTSCERHMRCVRAEEQLRRRRSARVVPGVRLIRAVLPESARTLLHRLRPNPDPPRPHEMGLPPSNRTRDHRRPVPDQRNPPPPPPPLPPTLPPHPLLPADAAGGPVRDTVAIAVVEELERPDPGFPEGMGGGEDPGHPAAEEEDGDDAQTECDAESEETAVSGALGGPLCAMKG